VRALLVAALLAAGVAAAQPAGVLVVDVDAALRDSVAAIDLREAELRERRALQDRFDAEKVRLEAREAELVELRARTEKAEFDRMVADFDAEVRRIRRAAQEDAAALQARFAAAQRALHDAARPIAEALMRERGAVVMLDRKAAVAFDPALDATAALRARLDAVAPDAARLLPVQAPSPRP
jgi:Skp family chaperone for outer membrane proteins